MKQFWMVQAAFPWTSLQTNLPFEVGKPPKGEPTHFCPVFDNREDAEKRAEGKWAVVPLQEKTDE